MTTRPLHPSVKRGFTFAEIMFAVMILGIGFIMVAGIFPVAIQQTQSTLQDLNGVAEAKRGSAIMRQIGIAISGYMQNYASTPSDLTNTGKPAFANLLVENQNNTNPHASAALHSFFETSAAPGARKPYEYVRGDLINQRDHRYAWLPIAYQVDFQPTAGAQARTVDANGYSTTDDNGNPAYYTASGSVAYQVSGNYVDASGNAVPATDIRGQVTPVARVLPETARVWVLAVQKRDPDSSEYTTTDRDAGMTTLPNANDGTFKPKVVYFKLVEGEDPNALSGGNIYPDTLVFTNATGTPQEEPAADQGAYVWVADDKWTTKPTAGSYTYPSNYKPGTANGRFYRLGAKRDDLGVGVYELQPGYDMQIKHGPGPDAFYSTNDDANSYYELENLPPRQYDNPNPASGQSNYTSIPGPSAQGFMIGKGLKNPKLPYNASTNPYVGGVQDVYALPAVTVVLRPQ